MGVGQVHVRWGKLARRVVLLFSSRCPTFRVSLFSSDDSPGNLAVF